jgi:gamma-glutamylcyclotransferase (GGCT)/AIG2-like uncharacterized protein YtfP
MKSDTGSELVFVYGTLRRGGSNAFRMDGAEFVGRGSVAGCLHAISWYPGLVLGNGCGRVVGEVYRVGAEHLRALDEFEGISASEIEGAEYRRVKAEVLLNDIEYCSAWVYEWTASVESRQRIPSGDWTMYELGSRVPLFTMLTLLPILGAGACLGIQIEQVAEVLQPSGIRKLSLLFMIGAPALGLVSAVVAELRHEGMRWLRVLFSVLSFSILFGVVAFLVQPH